VGRSRISTPCSPLLFSPLLFFPDSPHPPMIAELCSLQHLTDTFSKRRQDKGRRRWSLYMGHRVRGVGRRCSKVFEDCLQGWLLGACGIRSCLHECSSEAEQCNNPDTDEKGSDNCNSDNAACCERRG
jgi:hypothetical protein